MLRLVDLQQAAGGRVDLTAVVARDEHVRAEEPATVQDGQGGSDGRIQRCDLLVQPEPVELLLHLGRQEPLLVLQSAREHTGAAVLEDRQVDVGAVERKGRQVELPEPPRHRSTFCRMEIDQRYICFSSQLRISRHAEVLLWVATDRYTVAHDDVQISEALPEGVDERADERGRGDLTTLRLRGEDDVRLEEDAACPIEIRPVLVQDLVKPRSRAAAAGH